jgi:hypothetical protein
MDVSEEGVLVAGYENAGKALFEPEEMWEDELALVEGVAE